MFSPNDAAKIVGKSKSTILRDIRKGKLSAARGEGGGYQIDGAELARVYECGAPDAARGSRHDVPRPAPSDTGDAAMTHPKIEVLQVRLDAAERITEERDQTILDLRTRLDQSERERIDAQSKLTALLTDQRVPAPSVEGASENDFKINQWLFLLVIFAVIIWGMISPLGGL